MYIKNIKARQILDSRGNPTVEAEVLLNCGAIGRASVPSGASVGRNEALELRDNDSSMFLGKSVLQAVDNVNSIIAPELTGVDATNQREIDCIMIELDGTSNKTKLGANAILGVSLAVARAVSVAYKIPLYKYLGGINARIMPTPMINILNGGVHADNNVDFQEFMIAPATAATFEDAIRMSSEVFYSLKNILKLRNLPTSVGDEGGFAPNLKTNEEGIEIILEAIEKAHYSTNDIKICLDIASSEFYVNGQYCLKGEEKILTSEGMADFLLDLVNKYPIISIEDGMAENDWDGWKILTNKIGNKCQLVGDDLFTTNTKLLSLGIEKEVANAILIKVNQIGTLTEVLNAVNMAHSSGYSAIVSHRSGETEDTFISDLSVALNCGQIKAGSVSRTERIAKYNQLIRIEQELGSSAKYTGICSFSPLKTKDCIYTYRFL